MSTTALVIAFIASSISVIAAIVTLFAGASGTASARARYLTA